jgi:hypothetical protein
MTAGPVNLHYRSLAALIPLSVVAVVSWRLLSGSDLRSWNMVNQTDLRAHRHPIYWFDDGSVIVKVSDNQVDGQDGVVLFRIHEPLLRRRSKVVLQREPEDGCAVPTVAIPLVLGVQVQDFTSLLAHLYHDT